MLLCGCVSLYQHRPRALGGILPVYFSKVLNNKFFESM